MDELTVGLLPVLATLVGLQAVLALILAGILGAFHRLYRHAYLRHWSLSWLALLAYLVASLGPGRAPGGDVQGLRLLAALLSLLAGYLQVAWLLLGTWGLERGADVTPRTARRVLGVAIGASLASVLPALAGVTAPSPIGLRCLVAGVAYLSAAVLLARRRPQARVAGAFAGFALIVYGADQLAYFSLSFLPAARRAHQLPFLMAFDLLATAVVGIALVAWLLEGESERQVRAAGLARRREKAQACVYRISEAARTVWDLPEHDQVRRCAAYKAAVCLQDPHDRGPRNQLNLGHTFGHALEAAAGYDLPHGRAVALGMLAALEISGNGAAAAVVRRVLAPEPVQVDRDAAWAALARDKKAVGGTPRLVLLEETGRPTWGVEVPAADVRAALDGLIRG